MAKQSFQMLYALKATVRRFEGSNPTVAIIVGYKDAKSGNRVYRGLDDPWVKAIIEAVNDDAITAESLADAEDRFEIELDAPVELESGRLFSQKVPPLYQYFTVNEQEVRRRVDTVTGVLIESSGLTIDDMVRRTMTFRLTALDENGQHRYGVPKRKSIQLQLLAYWDGEVTRDFDGELTALADEFDKEDEEEQ
jgi:hypothetical protein|nr:MAG TPA: hypothetical protein [Caudoviricetes sp.]